MALIRLYNDPKPAKPTAKSSTPPSNGKIKLYKDTPAPKPVEQKINTPAPVSALPATPTVQYKSAAGPLPAIPAKPTSTPFTMEGIISDLSKSFENEPLVRTPIASTPMSASASPESMRADKIANQEAAVAREERAKELEPFLQQNKKASEASLAKAKELREIAERSRKEMENQGLGYRGTGGQSPAEANLKREADLLESTVHSIDKILDRNKNDRNFFQRMKDGAAEVTREPGKMVPFLSGIVGATEAAEIVSVVKKQQQGEKLSDRERLLLSDFQFKMLKNELVDTSAAEQIGMVLATMPTYAVEFGLTGGTFKTASTVVEATTSKVLPKIVSKGVATVAGAAAQTATGFAPRVAETTAQNMTPTYDVVKKDGDKLDFELTKNGDSFATALTKAFGTTFIEVATERAGGLIDKPMDALKRGIMGQYLAKIRATQGSQALKNIQNKIGWNGVIQEVFEEELANLGQAPIEGRPINLPFLTKEGTKRFLVEAGGSAGFGGFMKGTDIVGNRFSYSDKGEKLTDPTIPSVAVAPNITAEVPVKKGTEPNGKIRLYSEEIKPLDIPKGEDITPPQKLPKIEQIKYRNESKVADLQTEIQNMEMVLDESPAKNLTKYARGEGYLPEVTGDRIAGKFGRTGDQLISEMGFKDLDEAQDAYDQYLHTKKQILELKSELKEANKETFEDYDLGKLDKINALAQQASQNIRVIKQHTDRYKAENPVSETSGRVKDSAAFERVKKRIAEVSNEDVTYTSMKLAEDTARAVQFAEEYVPNARRIALGLEAPPEGMTETAISIAYAEKMRSEGKWKEFAEAERSRSLRQTRRGQEIAAERGRADENSADHFIRQVMRTRLENAGKKKFAPIKQMVGEEGRTAISRATDRIKSEAKALRQTITREKISIAEAQKLLDVLTC